jgi:TM2 domain-containing membrane protein YozV
VYILPLIHKKEKYKNTALDEDLLKIFEEYTPPDVKGESKSKVRSLVLAIFLGFVGAHNFYLGYTNKAMIQLILSVIGGFMTNGITTIIIEIWVIVEIIFIAKGRINTDADLRPIL